MRNFILMISYLKQLYKYRQLLWILTQREIKVRYKQTTLGILWAVLQPLSLMLIFTLVFSYFTKINSEGIPYPVFTFATLLPWQLIAFALSQSSNSLVESLHLVSKVYFPRLIIPISSVAPGSWTLRSPL